MPRLVSSKKLYSQTSEETLLKKITFYILSLLCIKIILILNKIATLDRWSQNINDLFGKFNCMYLYINTSSNLKMEPKVNEINWKNTFVRHWKKRITHTRTWLRGNRPEYETLYRRAPMPVSTASVRTPSHTERDVSTCVIYSQSYPLCSYHISYNTTSYQLFKTSSFLQSFINMYNVCLKA